MLPELLALLFGQSAAEELRDSKKTIAPPPEGDTNVSLGAVSAVFGSIGVLFWLFAILIAIPKNPAGGTSFGAIATFAAIGLACSCVGLHFGRMAPQVMRRHLRVAKYGVVFSAFGMVLSVVSLVVSIAGIFL